MKPDDNVVFSPIPSVLINSETLQKIKDRPLRLLFTSKDHWMCRDLETDESVIVNRHLFTPAVVVTSLRNPAQGVH